MISTGIRNLALRLICLVLSGAGPLPQCFAAAAEAYLTRPLEWFKSPEALVIGENILSWQLEDGDWPKNTDTISAARPPGTKTSGTFDNGATVGELRYLAKIYGATGQERFKAAFHTGLDLILRAQYANGGWPQSYPPGNGYPRHITFNDGTFVRLAEFVRDVGSASEFAFTGEERRDKARSAFERAVQCVLKTQIQRNHELTVWCAQHDEITLEPRSARTYELVSLSGGESAGLLRFLMRLENPSPEVRTAVESGVEWFEQSKLTGIRLVRENGERRIVQDASAPPLWARFYELGTNRPIFSGRDGIKRYSMDEIEAERRNGYAWYGDWGKAVLADYQAWRKRLDDPAAKRGSR